MWKRLLCKILGHRINVYSVPQYTRKQKCTRCSKELHIWSTTTFDDIRNGIR